MRSRIPPWLRTHQCNWTDEGNEGGAEQVVVVLGAGFSMVVYPSLPFTDELGDAVRERFSPEDRARVPLQRFQGAGGRFEEWLSYLSERQPHLTQDRSLEALALLLQGSDWPGQNEPHSASTLEIWVAGRFRLPGIAQPWSSGSIRTRRAAAYTPILQ
jgi:hypothetical protein